MQVHNCGPAYAQIISNGGLCNGGSASGPSSRTMERMLDDAQLTGELCISGRSIKEFPLSKHNLIDTSRADISRNRFVDMPREISQLVFLEHLSCRENLLRAIPQDFCRLTCLIELDLSRNNITSIPAILCKLPLQILLMNHNRMTALPVEIGQMRCLRELDISCNDIHQLPPQIGQISTLRRLDLRKNKLTQLPSELKKLSLTYLDISENFIAFLPSSLAEMMSLKIVHLAGNPLQSPPASVCNRGKIHVFKSLEKSLVHRSHAKESREVFSTRGIDPPPSDATKLPSVQKSIPVENLPINRLNLLSHLADNTGIYSVPQKLDRGIPTSPSCPAIFKNSLMQMTVPILGDKSSTSSPSSSGVASSTDGGSDEGVVSMIGSGDVADPPVAIYDSDKGVRRKIGNPTSQIPRKASPNQTGTGPCRSNGTLPLSSQIKNTGKPPTNTTSQRRLSSSGVGVVGTKDSVSSTSYHGNVSVGSNSDQSLNSTRNLSARPYLQKLSPVKKDSPSSSNSSKSKLSSGKSTAPTDDKSDPTKESNPNFTIRRQQEQLRDESEKLEMLKKFIQTRLKLTLPEDVMESLQDGVVLCHLVNNIRPRSVISIHVPPNTQSGILKLTSAKSRRNVENFLDACRRLGVPDVLICSPADILESKSPIRIYSTVNGLIQLEFSAVKRLPHGQQFAGVAQRALSARGPPGRDFSAV